MHYYYHYYNYNKDNSNAFILQVIGSKIISYSLNFNAYFNYKAGKNTRWSKRPGNLSLK